MPNKPTIESSVFNVEQTAMRWKTNGDAVRSWCKEGLIPGVIKSDSFPFRWLIPSEAKRPIDAELIHAALKQIVELQNSLINEIDLTEWGVPLKDSCQCIYTLAKAGYLSAIEGSTVTLTRKGISALCYCSSLNEPNTTPAALLWAADVTGRFSGSFAAAALDSLR